MPACLKNFFLLLALPAFFSCGTAKQKNVSAVTVSQPGNTAAAPVDPSDRFMGKTRAAEKTSFVTMPADTFLTIKALHQSLPGDKYMHTQTDAKHQEAPRTSEESHNVVVTDLFIFGIKREEDNDFHLILGSSHKLSKNQPYFSAEISGLPDPSSPYFAVLDSVRTTFKAYFGDTATKTIVFVASREHPPIHLRSICGSLFFDNHHFGDHSSVQGFKVTSAWEIHPVTSIVFDP